MALWVSRWHVHVVLLDQPAIAKLVCPARIGSCLLTALNALMLQIHEQMRQSVCQFGGPSMQYVFVYILTVSLFHDALSRAAISQVYEGTMQHTV